jgi:hypothetical protein
MRYIFSILAVLSVAFAAVLAPVPVSAQSQGAHFLDSAMRIEGTTVYGAAAGLGNETFTVVVEATGTYDVICINPGGRAVPGQSGTTTFTGETTIASTNFGRYNFTVELVPGAIENPCPNPRWTYNITNVQITSATAELYDSQGNLRDTFTF